MRFLKFMTLVLLPLDGCSWLGQPAPYNGTLAFDGGSTEPFVVQVYNNELGSGNTDKQIVVELTADQTLISAGDTFRRVILTQRVWQRCVSKRTLDPAAVASLSRLTTASSNRGFVHHPENGWLAAGGSNETRSK